MLLPAGMLWTFWAHLDSDLSISSIPFIAVYSSKLYGSSALHQAVEFSVPEDRNRIFTRMFLVKDWVHGQSPDKQPSSNSFKLSKWNGDQMEFILFAVIPAGAIQIASQGETVQGLHTLTMTNATTAGGAIVQYAQGQDGQFFVPGM